MSTENDMLATIDLREYLALTARVTQLEGELAARDRRIAVMWDVLGRHDRLFAMANDAVKALAPEAK